MGNEIPVRIDESLVGILGRIKVEVAEDMKKRYGLTEVKISGNLASQIAASKLSGNTILKFKIKKTGLNRGILELL